MSRYSLRRERDGAGDSGPMSQGIRFMDHGGYLIEDNARPRIGYAMRVGSLYGRTYAAQDWWQTTIIIEILEDTTHFVRFRTDNSVYEWRDDV